MLSSLVPCGIPSWGSRLALSASLDRSVRWLSSLKFLGSPLFSRLRSFARPRRCSSSSLSSFLPLLDLVPSFRCSLFALRSSQLAARSLLCLAHSPTSFAWSSLFPRSSSLSSFLRRSPSALSRPRTPLSRPRRALALSSLVARASPLVLVLVTRSRRSLLCITSASLDRSLLSLTRLHRTSSDSSSRLATLGARVLTKLQKPHHLRTPRIPNIRDVVQVCGDEDFSFAGVLCCEC